MTFLPIVARELRVASRQRGTYWGRLWAAIIAIAIAAFWAPVAASVSTSQGQLLFGALAGLGFAYSLFAGARITSDCISAEKREGTIGLLFLTDLKGYDVVLGKLFSCSLNAVYGLLGLVPVLSLALLLGGVTLAEVQRMALLLLSTLVFSLAAGVFASTLSRNDRRAMFATACIVIVVAGLPYTLASVNMYIQILANGNPSLAQYHLLLLPSPVFAFQMTTTAAGNPMTTGFTNRALVADFYDSILATLTISALLLAAASVLVPRVCRERPRSNRQARWLDFRNRWNYGAPAKRRALQRRLLDRNAFYWLAGRDRAKRYYVWLFLGALAVIWGWMVWVMGGPDWQLSLCLLFLAFVMLKIWVASEICSRLVEDRESGVFETLLVSPLQPKDVAHGQWLALARQFGLPVAACVALTWLLLHASINAWHGDASPGEMRFAFWAVVLMLVADLAALRWVAAWHALRTAQIQRAALAACVRLQLLPTVLFIVLYNLAFLLGQAGDFAFANNSLFVHGTALWLLIGLAADLWFGVAARWRFLRHFRSVAAERYMPHTPALEPFVDLVRNAWARVRPLGPPPVAAPEMTGWRWTRILAVSAVALLIVLPLGLWGWRHTNHRALDAQLEAVKAAGQPLSLAALDDWGQLVSDDENAATVIQKALWRVSSLGPAARGASGLGRLEWPGPVASLPDAQRIRVSNWVSTNRAALELMATAARVPKCRHHVYWGQNWPSSAVWQTFGRLQPFADLIAYDAMFRSDAGDLEGALGCIDTLLGLANALGQEPLLGAQTYRRNFLNAAVRVTERLLSQHRLSANQSTALRARLRDAELAAPATLSRAFIGERCVGITEFRLQGRQSPFWGAAPAGPAKIQAELVEFVAEASGVRDRWQHQYLTGIAACITNASQLAAGSSPALAAIDAPAAPPVRMMSRAQLASLESYWRQVLRLELETMARLRLAQTALALEEFRSLHADRRPDELTDLRSVSSETTKDPFATSALRYMRLNPGYLLYSVGMNQADNGGKGPEPKGDPHGQDIPFQVAR